jgi:indole-3-glycerol phosphate synthase
MKFLEQILAQKQAEIRELHAHFSLRRFRDSEYFAQPTGSLIEALDRSPEVSIIAEIKKASPAAGLIRSDFDPLKIAGIYATNRVAAVSVLTDQKYFMGSLADLRRVADTVDLPLLRKDFILDEYQVYESRAGGADAILLIAEILTAGQIAALTAAAASVQLEVLLEIHGIEQLEKINFTKNRLIGINNRNLNTLQVDTDTAVKIKKLLPAEVVTVAESGIHEQSQVEKIKKAGIQAILVGEYLMRAADPGIALRELQEWCRNAY